MKSLQATELKTVTPTKVMYTVICRYVDQAFDDMSDGSEEKKHILMMLS